MKVIYDKSPGLTDSALHYCPGCTHGIIHKLIAEALVDLDVLGSAIGVAPVGCSVFAYQYFNCDMQEAAHGRAPAVATGIKRVHPEAAVFTYQGDGDLAAIGTAEVVHAAVRGEKITTIFVNNAIYGMTGGQMAPTTLVGQKATTAPFGRTEALHGKPLRVSELLATVDGAKFVERVSLHDPAHVRRAGRAIREAFECQIRGEGFSFVEVLSTCPTNWGLTPAEALHWLEENMIPYYSLGKFRTPEGGSKND
ncbi:thiamine pyrophosphate-dependent enzyme [Papillibacter cinnamivorans]|uniref:2-oxoglutarate ferredoxin oxidoreductase subunit beta n=1 Tax=Papillibacter cinnamivorans DSM 12816 TaxID=1122930 RepID=A0A1W2CQS5_9FIRM|nr:thiamine pyrophosphate-dependent enzyme [Papillibacter cinnamivorans]SMC87553.1 2-oxoglutarate ferredoxin oxidoreductase subunit beta [Papillibacter cinnamivorans DSM 12816]